MRKLFLTCMILFAADWHLGTGFFWLVALWAVWSLKAES